MKELMARLAQASKALRDKRRQTARLSMRTTDFAMLLIGALAVACVSLGFAKLADRAIGLNAALYANRPWLAFVTLPLGLMALAWLTRAFAPFASGSGIPQVICALSVDSPSARDRLLSLPRTLLKIPFAFAGMVLGASIGREGPSVQVGGAVMRAWGLWCEKKRLTFARFDERDMMVAGAAGGMAAAFNAPLAGLIFAIEELGRGRGMRWSRNVMLGILASGFFLIALDGNNHHFPTFGDAPQPRNLIAFALLIGVIDGLMGGLFARLLGKGFAGFLPQGKWRERARRRPIAAAGLLGLALAGLGCAYGGATYGTGYALGADALLGVAQPQPGIGPAKFAATVMSYWSGIPGGIFSPCLSIGAAIASELGWVAQALGMPPTMLALMSMAAFLAGATQSPISSAVIMMEMTGAQPMLFWVLVSCLVSSAISGQVSPAPFYHAQAANFKRRLIEMGAEAAGQAGTSGAAEAPLGARPQPEAIGEARSDAPIPDAPIGAPAPTIPCPPSRSPGFSGETDVESKMASGVGGQAALGASIRATGAGAAAPEPEPEPERLGAETAPQNGGGEPPDRPPAQTAQRPVLNALPDSARHPALGAAEEAALAGLGHTDFEVFGPEPEPEASKLGAASLAKRASPGETPDAPPNAAETENGRERKEPGGLGPSQTKKGE